MVIYSPPSIQLSTEEWIYVRKLPRQGKSQRKGLKKSVSGILTGLGTRPVPSNLDYKKEYSRGFCLSNTINLVLNTVWIPSKTA